MCAALSHDLACPHINLEIFFIFLFNNKASKEKQNIRTVLDDLFDGKTKTMLQDIVQFHFD